MRTPDEVHEDYKKYRGKCKELSEAACREDSTLTLVRGHYFCPLWNVDEPHWWCVRADGTIFDPTARQFPSHGIGIYTPFSGSIECEECGKSVEEESAYIDGHHAFCSGHCFGRHVGLL